MTQNDENRQREKEPLCKSVFRDGKSTTTREAYTQVWIRLINDSVRRRCTAAADHGRHEGEA